MTGYLPLVEFIAHIRIFDMAVYLLLNFLHCRTPFVALF